MENFNETMIMIAKDYRGTLQYKMGSAERENEKAKERLEQALGYAKLCEKEYEESKKMLQQVNEFLKANGVE
jgi:phage shock protein A